MGLSIGWLSPIVDSGPQHGLRINTSGSSKMDFDILHSIRNVATELQNLGVAPDFAVHTAFETVGSFVAPDEWEAEYQARNTEWLDSFETTARFPTFR